MDPPPQPLKRVEGEGVDVEVAEARQAGGRLYKNNKLNQTSHDSMVAPIPQPFSMKSERQNLEATIFITVYTTRGDRLYKKIFPSTFREIMHIR
jgi:hypothetical protein